MNIKQYESTGQRIYAQLALVIRNVLLAAIEKHPSLRLQHIQHRAKSVSSLRKKLTKAGKLRSTAIEDCAKDLGGCRLIFYTNGDVSRFLNSGIIFENFEVDWDRTKIHHPQPEATDAAELFVSNNYVVKLRAERAGLPEYSDVADMWCEVQVQTTLNHAWSEMAHDTIYKKPELPQGFGSALMQSIDDRMKAIQRDYLLPAGHEFQKVQADFERLSSGKELFDTGALDAIATGEDNNDRYDLLEAFKSYVLPHHDDPISAYPDIRKSLVAAVEKARMCPENPVVTLFGNYPGRNAEAISAKVADILDDLKYADIGASFDTFCHLYASSQTGKERDRWVQSGEKLASHNLRAWKQVGPAVQDVIVGKIAKMPPDRKNDLSPFVTSVLSKLLGSEVSGTTSSYNSVTFHQGSVQASMPLRKIRTAAMDELKSLFLAADTEKARKASFSAMHAATRFPNAGSLSDELHQMILADALDLVTFLTENASIISFEQTQHVEHQFLWLFHHNRETSTTRPASKKVSIARRKLTKAIFGFRDRVNGNADYVTYKTLVGYESVFEQAWLDDGFDIQGEQDYRSRKIDALVADVSDDNADEWFARLIRCAETESNDLATFPSFGTFLERLGSANPKILFAYLKREHLRLMGFLTSILRGLEEGALAKRASALIQKWVKAGKFLPEISWYFRVGKLVDLTFAKQTLDIALSINDRSTILTMIAVADARHAEWGVETADAILLPAIAYFGKEGDSRWANSLWGSRSETNIFGTLTLAQSKMVLSALVAQPDIEWREEDVLCAIAKRHPEAIVEFFEQRVAFEPVDNDGGRYSAIPFQFYRLPEFLAGIPKKIVSQSFDWFVSDDSLFEYRGGKLIANIYPTMSAGIEAELLPFANSPDLVRRRFAAKVLRSYNGEEFLHPLCKEVIAASDANDDLLEEIHIVIDETGVVSGEFGMVEAYVAKREAIAAWLKDPRKAVKVFAKKHIALLDRMIASEQRRAEGEIEQRKRDWGEGAGDAA
jgi:ppGpp synthetase/RelA/SpoT-type nucleotidyltranferase